MHRAELHRFDKRELDQLLGDSFRETTVRITVSARFHHILTLVQHRKQAFQPS